jgi:hypothetical protein
MVDSTEGPLDGSDLGRVRGETAKFEYVKDGLPVTDYVRVKKDPSSVYVPTGDYHPTALIGMCSGCRTVGNVEFPNGFDFKAGDRIMDKKLTKLFCLNCQRETEFIPYADSCDLLRESQKTVKRIMGVGE